jgi:hypothetical protein
MALERLQGVAGTGWLEATGATEPRTEEETIGPHRQRQQTPRPECEGLARVHAGTARTNNCSSSLLAAWRSASDAALGNSRTSKGARNRITHWPGNICG